MTISQERTANLLLRSLDQPDFDLLRPHLKRVTFALRHLLHHRDDPITHNHFVESGVCSIVIDQERGEQVEVGMFGHEGMSGTAAILKAGQSPHTSMVQCGDCVSLSIPTDELQRACGRSPTLQASLLRYAQTLAVQASHTAGSNAYNALPERLARWLLMCHDRLDGDHLPLTHEFVSTMLAVRRSGVTTTLHTLESTGSIRSMRGMVIVRDRPRLEEIAGDSYGGPEAEYRRLITAFGKSGSGG